GARGGGAASPAVGLWAGFEPERGRVEVPAPASGVLSEIVVKAGDTVAVGSVLGAIAEGDGKAKPAPAKAAAAAQQPAPQAAPAPVKPPEPSKPPKMQPAALEREPSPREEVSDSGNGTGAGSAEREMPPSPAARKYLAETGLSPASVVGSGRRGQVLKQDVLAQAGAALSESLATAVASLLAREPKPKTPPAPR